jgi:hypothetical protein
MLDSIWNFIDLFFVGWCVYLLVRDRDNSIWSQLFDTGLICFFAYVAFYGVYP